MRLKYLDALRGLCIFLVMYWHVMTYSGNADSALGQCIMSFMLPIFFFISALVGYKSPEKMADGKTLWANVKTKISTLLIPVFVVYTFFQLFSGGSPLHFFSKGLYGYWFVLTLFEISVVYYVVTYLLRNCQKLFDGLAVCVILFSSFVGIGLASMQEVLPSVLTVLGAPAFFIYLPFFLLGIMVKKHEGTLLKLMASDRVFALSVMLYALCFLLNRTVVTKEFNVIGYYLLSSFVLKYLGLIMVFNVFYHSAEYFNADGRISRVLQFMGKRSLDMYLLHYFLLIDFQGFRGGVWRVRRHHTVFHPGLCTHGGYAIGKLDLAPLAPVEQVCPRGVA